MSVEKRPVHEHRYGAAVIPCSQDHAPDERQAGLREALTQANWVELAEEAIEGGFRHTEVEPELLLRVLRAALAAPAQEEREARREADRAMDIGHGRAAAPAQVEATQAPDATVQHGHMDTEADPSYESNVTIHAHTGGGQSHRHKDAPSWGAIGDRYMWPSWAERVLAEDRDGD